MLNTWVLISCFILCLVAFSCQRSAAINDQVLARVGSSTLTISEARSNIPVQVFTQDSLQAYQDYVDQWIKRQLILEEADRLDLQSSPEISKRIASAKEEAILNSFKEAVFLKNEDNFKEVSYSEAQVYYQANKDRFLLDERYIKFRHIIARNLGDAENAKRDLMRGYTWERVSNQYSKYPSLSIQGANQFFPASAALKEYAVLNRYLQIIGISEISLIERIGDDYHFVQLIDERADGEHPDLDWLISQIQDWLILEKKRRAYNSYLNNLYLSAQANNEIEIYNVLPAESSKELTDTVSINTE